VSTLEPGHWLLKGCLLYFVPPAVVVAILILAGIRW
jgi:hypothetical protein